MFTYIAMFLATYVFVFPVMQLIMSIPVLQRKWNHKLFPICSDGRQPFVSYLYYLKGYKFYIKLESDCMVLIWSLNLDFLKMLIFASRKARILCRSGFFPLSLLFQIEMKVLAINQTRENLKLSSTWPKSRRTTRLVCKSGTYPRILFSNQEDTSELKEQVRRQ